ncbi:hypothetical protein AAWM_04524 [Aspergillus awamori]|uniref:Uncharacterized protein n=1 Tax=Aspergillus awamori TaxID=105351 RepID=A0A401KQZ1_ASPAW|nr:hypothetical protein AAWM_04524 [Aspergillus awamori]
MSTKPQTSSKETESIPEGWRDDPFHVQGAEYQEFAYAYGLTNVSVLLTQGLDIGEHGFICSSNGRYYLGDEMAYCMLEITKPTTYSGILHVLNTKGQNGLRMKSLQMVPYAEQPESGPGGIWPGTGCYKTCAKLRAANS